MANLRLNNSKSVLHVGQRRILVGPSTFQVAHFLMDLESYLLKVSQAPSHLAELLDTREDFYRIVEMRPIAGLMIALDQGGPLAQRMAIWLLGKCNARIVTPQIAEFRESEDVQVRRAVARALCRLTAWSDLNWLEHNDPDKGVRRLAIVLAPPPRPFSDRLARFKGAPVESLHEAKPFESRMPLIWDADHFDGKPPKPAWLIRRILERIRQAVTGFATSGK